MYFSTCNLVSIISHNGKVNELHNISGEKGLCGHGGGQGMMVEYGLETVLYSLHEEETLILKYTNGMKLI